MSLSEKAAQLDAIADGQTVGSVWAALQAAMDLAEQVGQEAAAVIGDLPAGADAQAAWQQVKSSIEGLHPQVGAAMNRLKDIANAVRNAGA